MKDVAELLWAMFVVGLAIGVVLAAALLPVIAVARVFGVPLA